MIFKKNKLEKGYLLFIGSKEFFCISRKEEIIKHASLWLTLFACKIVTYYEVTYYEGNQLLIQKWN